MCAKLLSSEEIAKLKGHPYVIDANERFVCFTVAFKERFYKEYQNGRKPKRILMDMGLDTDLLGKCRINSIKLHVLQQAQGKKGFTDLESQRFGSFIQDKTPEEKIKRLEHELAYTKQELEFVKKIVKANREAQIEWESKQHPVSNT
jgi:transposase